MAVEHSPSSGHRGTGRRVTAATCAPPPPAPAFSSGLLENLPNVPLSRALFPHLFQNHVILLNFLLVPLKSLLRVTSVTRRCHSPPASLENERRTDFPGPDHAPPPQSVWPQWGMVRGGGEGGKERKEEFRRGRSGINADEEEVGSSSPFLPTS